MKTQQKALSILHLAICFGAILLILILHFVVKPIDLSNLSSKVGSMAMVGLCISSVNVLLANLIFKKKTASIGTDQINESNMTQFAGAYVFKWVLMEGAIIVNVLLYFFAESHAMLIVISLLLLLLLYVSKPKFR